MVGRPRCDRRRPDRRGDRAARPSAAPRCDHPVARSVARALPGLIDAGVLPDAVHRRARAAAFGPRPQARPRRALAQLAPLLDRSDALRVAVTGASGFVGGAVATALAEPGTRSSGSGGAPAGWSHPTPSIARWDITTGPPRADARLRRRRALRRARRRLGAARRRAAGRTATARARWSRASPARGLVHLSTSSVYDALDAERATSREDAAPVRRFLSAYSESKALAEVELAGTDAVILRPHAVYGPGDTTLLPRILAGVRRGRLVLPERRPRCGTASPTSTTWCWRCGARSIRRRRAAPTTSPTTRRCCSRLCCASSSSAAASPRACVDAVPAAFALAGGLEAAARVTRPAPPAHPLRGVPARARAHPRPHRRPRSARLPPHAHTSGGRRALVTEALAYLRSTGPQTRSLRSARRARHEGPPPQYPARPPRPRLWQTCTARSPVGRARSALV